MKLLAFAALALTLLVATDAQQKQCKKVDIDDDCVDKTRDGGGLWYDASGPASENGDLPDCDWYGAYWDRCQRDGMQHKHFGMTACEACCVCGGGEEREDEKPDDCEDASGWYVQPSSTKYKCSWFADDDERCDRHGKVEGEDDLNANEACCVCGGGVTPEEWK
mmetsp:Transcript_22095/g.33392  ORF Transcript_22095/g.33392 Transcript_22095/m.33392 type:complete len:164 (-) Transcript_22095:81-572(-)